MPGDGSKSKLTPERAQRLKTAFHHERGQRIRFAREFGVNPTTITKWLKRLNIAEPVRRRTDQEARYALTEERRAYLIRHFTGQYGQIAALARSLNVPRHILRYWLRQLQLHHPQQQRPWTSEDCQYLQRNILRQSYEAIAEHLGHPLSSVYTKAGELGLHKGDEGYTQAALCLALGCSPVKIQRWIAAGWLHPTRRHVRAAEGQNGDWYLFTERDVQQFLLRYPQAIADLAHFDYIWLHDLLVGGKKGTGSYASERKQGETSAFT